MRKRGSPILGIHHIGSDRFVWKYCTPRSNGLLSLSPVNVPFEGGLHIFRLIHIYGCLSALSWCHWSWHVLTHPDVEGSRSSQFPPRFANEVGNPKFRSGVSKFGSQPPLSKCEISQFFKKKSEFWPTWLKIMEKAWHLFQTPSCWSKAVSSPSKSGPARKSRWGWGQMGNLTILSYRFNHAISEIQ